MQIMNGLLDLQKPLGIDHLLDTVQIDGRVSLQDRDGILRIGIAHGQADHETVQLGFRQFLGTGGTKRVLGGQYKERLRYFTGHAFHGRVTLLHNLQKRGLRFRGGTVDLVGQEKVGIDRTFLETEFSAGLVI